MWFQHVSATLFLIELAPKCRNTIVFPVGHASAWILGYSLNLTSLSLLQLPGFIGYCLLERYLLSHFSPKCPACSHFSTVCSPWAHHGAHSLPGPAGVSHSSLHQRVCSALLTSEATVWQHAACPDGCNVTWPNTKRHWNDAAPDEKHCPPSSNDLMLSGPIKATLNQTALAVCIWQGPLVSPRGGTCRRTNTLGKNPQLFCCPESPFSCLPPHLLLPRDLLPELWWIL